VLIVDHTRQPVVSWRPGNRTIRHASKALGSTHLTTGEQWFEPGQGAPMHFHPDGVEEVLVVISGKALFWLENDEFVLEAGQSVILPPLSRHGFVALEPLHLGGGGLSSAVQTTMFLDEPDRIYDIGDTEGLKLDAHRRLRVRNEP
jgi:quercetin dioxygenase-like cupin family protein